MSFVIASPELITAAATDLADIGSTITAAYAAAAPYGRGFGPRIREGLRRRLDRRPGLPLFDTDIPRAAPRTNYPPLRLVHDPDDPDSPYATSERIIEARPGAQLVKTRGLGRLAHYRILIHRPAIRAGVDFIGRAPAVCGGDETKTSAM
jgi:pimeloyl-ACP methyl ester carboxylesterase